MRAFIDAQLPPQLARRLVQLGHEAWHAADFDMLRAPDRDIWRKASELGAVLITKDADFVTLRALSRDGPAVVWVRIGNATRRVVVRKIEAALPAVVAALDRGEMIVVIA